MDDQLESRDFKYYLFDLDGTINDSGSGIMKSVQYALDKMGYPPQPEELLRKFVGPSLMESFTFLFQMPEEQAREAVRLYRENYIDNEAIFDLEVYHGIRNVLKKLKDQGKTTAIVTFKPRVMTEPSETVMIGGTCYDVEGAKACGIASVGVTYGYGTREELTEAGADYLADEPEDLLKLGE